VLDLYAGTGALALEAISRGAEHATMIERDRAALAAIDANVEALAVADRVTVLGCAVEKPPASLFAGPPFDLVFADPPYADVGSGEVQKNLGAYVKALARYAVVVLEHSAQDAAPELAGLVRASTRRYGDSSVTLYDAAKDPSPS
jgi:16S rRNA (guanine966-N2)-methyltransferase